VAKTATGFVASLPRGHRIETPAYHRGRIYAGAMGGYELHALDAETGKSEFSLHLSDDGPTAPACQDGICVFNTYSCTVFAVDAETGEQLWSWWLGSPQLATTVIAQNMVLSSYPDPNGPIGANYVLAAFDLKSGKPLWRRYIDGEVNAMPVAVDDLVYVATVTGKLYELAAADGTIVSVQANDAASAPVVADHRAFYPRGEAPRNDMLAASEMILPEIESRHELRGRAITPRPRPLVAQDRLIRVERGVLVATNRNSGQELWTHALSDDGIADVSAPLLYAGRRVLLATAGGNVLALDPDSGRVTDTFSLGNGAFSSPPIVHGGWIYAGTVSGLLVGFDTGDAELTGWEMLGGGPDRSGVADSEES
jgi:outer membrane protein assembly factor BamB